MKHFHRYILVLVLVISLLGSVSSALAQNSTDSGGKTNGAHSTESGGATQGTFKITNPLSGINSIGDLVKNFVEIFSYIAVLFAVLVIIYIGFQFIMQQGKPEEIRKLKEWLLYACIGIAIVIGARLIVDVVINTLSATGAVSPNVIQSAKDANK